MSNLEYISAPYPTLPPIYENDNGKFWRSRSTPSLMTLHGQPPVLEKKRSHPRANVCPFPVHSHAEISFDPSIQQQLNQGNQVSEIQPRAIFEAKPEPLASYKPQLEQQITQHKLTEQDLRQTILDLRRVNQELEYLVHIDALTQVANRRCFDESLHREWQRSLRAQQPLSLVLLDIDLPGNKSIDLVRQIKKINAATAAIVLSIRVDDATQKQYNSLGADFFFGRRIVQLLVNVSLPCCVLSLSF